MNVSLVVTLYSYDYMYYLISYKIVIVHLMKRHCGVLGLAALVEAYPYSVPMWLPEVMDELAVHLHDPAPIAVSLLRGIGY